MSDFNHSSGQRSLAGAKVLRASHQARRHARRRPMRKRRAQLASDQRNGLIGGIEDVDLSPKPPADAHLDGNQLEMREPNLDMHVVALSLDDDIVMSVLGGRLRAYPLSASVTLQHEHVSDFKSPLGSGRLKPNSRLFAAIEDRSR